MKGINLEIYEREIFALLGPNGAGKTTLIRILAEGLGYDAGEIKVFGRRLSKETARFIGYVPQESISYDLLTVEENLKFYADLYDAPKKKIYGLIDRFALPKKKKAKELSGGFKRRLNLAISLLYDPKILILDEPSIGLDFFLFQASPFTAGYRQTPNKPQSRKAKKLKYSNTHTHYWVGNGG